MSFRDSPEPRRVDLAGMFGCLADAGDAGVMALESELTTCMKEADEWRLWRNNPSSKVDRTAVLGPSI
ncbi:hypothetical protein Pmar_PMAR010310 [Perkinsus marinus ATCC 50983]|uniref:Uncharacterized protein n=1 Tax=Perkinsus marinus (strain ATCC 50983 / TXsc) TaxID=423536 RepID=C5K5E1_PERM5|nr:hypothetical protein Pmar_PMAR010310 [Perkinsus marinus ATCC 50983]EER20563.1 hypothetical protein Pmar_PMAR010310 [Perkinsus marinus ATCC 50983]|eukprot:XP_002788767.1 hypothetical protein Pmar_PMAR010310 [Perkinsus marinus ATCC 50983]